MTEGSVGMLTSVLIPVGSFCTSEKSGVRRVIMPAGTTYNRLHDVIQSLTNFEGGYPVGDYHMKKD